MRVAEVAEVEVDDHRGIGRSRQTTQTQRLVSSRGIRVVSKIFANTKNHDSFVRAQNTQEPTSLRTKPSIQNLDSGRHSATFIANSSFDLNSAAKCAFSPWIPFSLIIFVILA